MSCQREGSGIALQLGIHSQTAILEQPEKVTVRGLLLHARAAQARVLAAAERVLAVAFGAMIGKEIGTSGDGVRLGTERIYFRVIIRRDVLHPGAVGHGHA